LNSAEVWRESQRENKNKLATKGTQVAEELVKAGASKTKKITTKIYHHVGE